MPKHARSRDGCVNCKQKRIKCDETKPHCKNCIDRHLKCPGFARQLKWKTIPASTPESTYGQQDSQRTISGRTQTLDSTISPGQTRPRAAQARPNTNIAAQEPANFPRPRVHSLQLNSEDTQDQLLLTIHPTPILIDGGQCSNHSFSHQSRRQNRTTTISEATFEPDELDLARYEQGYSHDPTSSHGTCSSDEQLYLTSTDHIWAPTPHEVATVASGDVQSLSKELSETMNQNATAFLECINLDNAWLSESVNSNLVPTANLSDINDTAADELNREITEQGQDQIDLWTMCLPTMPLHNDARLDPGTKTALTTHYFDFICQIVSCFDSHESPFRADIPQRMLTCDFIHDCVVGMSAAHLANSVYGMEDIAQRHQTRAMSALSPVINSVFPAAEKGPDNYWLSCSSSKTSRYHALLASLLLNMSSAWYDSSSTGLSHLFGARLLFQAWLVDEGLTFEGDRPLLLTRQQSFIVGAMAFLECLASMIIDQANDVLEYMRRFTRIAEDQRIYPNPWTGVSTPLFIIMAEVATLIRQRRNFNAMSSAEPQSKSLSELDASMAKHAAQLFASALTHRTLPTARMEETKDTKTPLEDLVGMDCIFRLIILLELSQIFPDLVLCDDNHGLDKLETQREADKVALNLAIAAVRLISELPKTSGTLIMLSIPLISAGSALQNIESCRCNYECDSDSLDGLRRDIFNLVNRPLPIAIWRDQVELRIELLERRVGLAPVRKMRELLKAVWRQADRVDVNSEASMQQRVHWMDVMIEEKLETLLG